MQTSEGMASTCGLWLHCRGGVVQHARGQCQGCWQGSCSSSGNHVLTFSSDAGTWREESRVSWKAVQTSAKQNCLHGRVPRQKPLLNKSNIKTHLSFPRKHCDDPQDVWQKLTLHSINKIELNWVKRLIANAWLLLRVAKPVIRFRYNHFLTQGLDGLDFLFPHHNEHLHLETAFCV